MASEPSAFQPAAGRKRLARSVVNCALATTSVAPYRVGSSVEPLMPIDYAIGVGTFVPNNAVIIHEDAVALMARVMKERGITHTTSECTLRGFTCAQARVDPKVASPAEILRARKLAIGHQIEGVTGGLEAK